MGKKQGQIRRRALFPALLLGLWGGYLFFRHQPLFFIPAILSLYFIAGLAVCPSILKPADALARLLTSALLWITTRILLALVFFLVITPIGLWFRLRGRDRLRLKFPAQDDSFWHRRPPDDQTPKMDKQY